MCLNIPRPVSKHILSFMFRYLVIYVDILFLRLFLMKVLSSAYESASDGQ